MSKRLSEFCEALLEGDDGKVIPTGDSDNAVIMTCSCPPNSYMIGMQAAAKQMGKVVPTWFRAIEVTTIIRAIDIGGDD